MHLFAADNSPDIPTSRTAVPSSLLRRLAFGRPPCRAIQPAQPAPRAETPQHQRSEPAADLDQRVRESGEW